MGLEDDPFFPFGVSVCLAFFSVVLLLNCRGVKKKTGSREKNITIMGICFFFVGLFQATVCFRNACEGGQHASEILFVAGFLHRDGIAWRFISR